MSKKNNSLEDQIKGFQFEIEKASKKKKESFFNWLNNSGGDVDSNFLRGNCDFSIFILYPAIQFLKNTNKKTALEIGYGGGRLLAAASVVFKKVIGIDIHNNSKLVAAELRKRKVENFELMQTNGKRIPLKQQMVDFVYSFIVLQHVEKIEILVQYIEEAHRVLKPGGVAVLYFGRLSQFSKNSKSRMLYLWDRMREKLYTKGYKKLDRKVNETNLVVTFDYAKMLAKISGFNVLGGGVSKGGPNLENYRGQYYLVLQR